MEKLRPYPGFASLSSDRFNHTPNLQIDIRRDQAKIRGVSETRILGCCETRIRRTTSI